MIYTVNGTDGENGKLSMVIAATVIECKPLEVSKSCPNKFVSKLDKL